MADGLEITYHVSGTGSDRPDDISTANLLKQLQNITAEAQKTAVLNFTISEQSQKQIKAFFDTIASQIHPLNLNFETKANAGQLQKVQQEVKLISTETGQLRFNCEAIGNSAEQVSKVSHAVRDVGDEAKKAQNEVKLLANFTEELGIQQSKITQLKAKIAKSGLTDNIDFTRVDEAMTQFQQSQSVGDFNKLKLELKSVNAEFAAMKSVMALTSEQAKDAGIAINAAFESMFRAKEGEGGLELATAAQQEQAESYFKVISIMAKNATVDVTNMNAAFEQFGATHSVSDLIDLKTEMKTVVTQIHEANVELRDAGTGAIDTVTLETIGLKFQDISRKAVDAGLDVTKLTTSFNELQATPTESSLKKYNENLAALRAELSLTNTEQRLFNKEQKATSDALTNDRSWDLYNRRLTEIQSKWGAVQKNPKLMAEFFSLKTLGNMKGGTEQLKQAWHQLRMFESSAREAGLATQTLGEKFKKSFNNFFSRYAGITVIWRLFSRIKQMAAEVKTINAAVVDLKMVTQATDSQMSKFLTSATKQAQKLGATISDVVESYTRWYKLGFTDTKDLETLTDVSTKFQAVSNIGDVETAVKDIVSAIKGYGLVADDAEHIADVLTKLGDTYATDAASIAEGMTRSAAALNQANTSYEESLALITAGTEVTQDASSVGTALRTVTLRLRGAKVELQEAGLDADNMAESTSKLREQVMALTKGFDILSDENTFKNPYEILKGIAAVWGDLEDINRAALLELISGKRNSNVTAAIIQNWSQVEKALGDAMTASGTLNKKYTVYEEGIEFKTKQLKASVQDLSQSIISSDILTKGAQGLNILVKAATGLIKAFNGAGDAAGNLFMVITAGLTAIAAKYKVIAPFTATMQNGTWSAQYTNKGRNAFNPSGFLGGLFKVRYSEKDFALAEQYNAQFAQTADVTAALNNQTSALSQTFAQMSPAMREAALAAAENGKAINLMEMRMQAATIKATALNTVISLGVGLALMGLVSVIGKVINSAKQAREDLRRAQQESIDNAIQTAKDYQSLTDSIDDYSESIRKLKETLADSNATQQEQYNAKLDLLSIQDDIVAKYELEKGAVDLLNQSLDETITKLREKQALDSQDWLSSPETKTASDALADSQTFVMNWQRIGRKGVQFVSDATKQGLSLTSAGTNTLPNLAYYGTAQDYYQALGDLWQSIQDSSAYTEDELEKIAAIITTEREKLKNDHPEIDSADEFYDKLWSNLWTAQGNYESYFHVQDLIDAMTDALAAGDTTKYNEALAQLLQIEPADIFNPVNGWESQTNEAVAWMEGIINDAVAAARQNKIGLLFGETVGDNVAEGLANKEKLFTISGDLYGEVTEAAKNAVFNVAPKHRWKKAGVDVSPLLDAMRDWIGSSGLTWEELITPDALDEAQRQSVLAAQKILQIMGISWQAYLKEGFESGIFDIQIPSSVLHTEIDTDTLNEKVDNAQSVIKGLADDISTLRGGDSLDADALIDYAQEYQDWAERINNNNGDVLKTLIELRDETQRGILQTLDEQIETLREQGEDTGWLEYLRQKIVHIGEDIKKTAEVLEAFGDALAKVGNTSETLQSQYDILITAQRELAENGSLTASTWKSLFDLDLLKYLTNTSKGIELNTEAFLDNTSVVLAEARAKLQLSFVEQLDALAASDATDAQIIHNQAMLDGVDAANNLAGAMGAVFQAYGAKAFFGKTKQLESMVQGYQAAMKLLEAGFTIEAPSSSSTKSRKKSSSPSGKDSILSKRFQGENKILEYRIGLLEKLDNLYAEGSEKWIKNQEDIINLYKKQGEIVLSEYNRLLAKGYDLSNQEMRELAESYVEIMGNMQKATETLWDAMRDKVTNALESVSSHTQAVIDLKEAYHSLLTSIRGEMQSLQTELQAAMEAYPNLTDYEKEALFSNSDYNRLTAQLQEIAAEAEAMYLDYLDQINNVGEETANQYEYITNEFERQYELKLKEYEVAKANLAVLKAQIALENTRNERNVSMLIDGRWQWVADPEAVQEAVQQLGEAQQAASEAAEELVHDTQISELEAYKDAVNQQIDVINSLTFGMDDMSEVLDDTIALLGANGANGALDLTNDALRNAQGVLGDVNGYLQSSFMTSVMSAADNVSNFGQQTASSMQNFVNSLQFALAHVDFEKVMSDAAAQTGGIDINSPNTDVSGAKIHLEAPKVSADADKMNVDTPKANFSMPNGAIVTMTGGHQPTGTHQGLGGGHEATLPYLYASGGVDDYTGLAVMHGTPRNSEVVFNSEQASKLYDIIANESVDGILRHIISNMSPYIMENLMPQQKIVMPRGGGNHTTNVDSHAVTVNGVRLSPEDSESISSIFYRVIGNH